MDSDKKKQKRYPARSTASGLWFLGAVGTLVYFLHFHSGTIGLVLLAVIKAIFWPAFLVYYLFKFMGI